MIPHPALWWGRKGRQQVLCRKPGMLKLLISNSFLDRIRQGSLIGSRHTLTQFHPSNTYIAVTVSPTMQFKMPKLGPNSAKDHIFSYIFF